MHSQAIIEVNSEDSLVGKVEKLSKAALFVSFDKRNNTSKLINGKHYFVSIISNKGKARVPCKLIQYDYELVYFHLLSNKADK
ncbi:MAG: hypothetical protein HQL69_04880 [Magnetococcales bacterium]|nr:hypothetical protein [Magnetococcales bacterium]